MMEQKLSVGQADDPQTMVYTVDLGNGHVVDIEGPANATPEQLQSFVAQQPQFNGQEVSAQGQTMFGDEQPAQAQTKMTPEQEAKIVGMVRSGASADDLRAAAQKMGFQFNTADQIVKARDSGQQYSPDFVYNLPKVETDTAGSFGRGVADTLMFGTLPKVGAAVAGAEAALRGDNFGDAYSRQLDYNNATIGSDEQDHAWSRVFGQLVGGFGLPSGIEGVGFSAGKQALRAGRTMEEARAAAASAIRTRMATVGGAYGAAHGAGSGDNPTDMLSGALTEGALGAATGGLMGQAGRLGKTDERVTNATQDAKNVFDAAQRQNLPVDAAAVGGPFVRSLTAALEQTPLGVIPIAQSARALNAAGESRVAALASDIGAEAADREGLGTIASEGAQKYAQIAKRAGGRLYDIAAKEAGNATVDLKQTRDLVDQQIARLQAVPGGGAGLSELQKLRADLDRPSTVQAVRDMRTEMFVDPQFRNTPVEGRYKLIAGAAARDAEDSLRAQGLSKAADAYRAADDNWRSMLVNLKRNIEPLIGKMDNLKSPEAVASGLNSAMKNNGARVAKFIDSLPNEQQSIVRASMLSPLGRDNDGAFSLARFATDWGKLSPASKRLVFGAETKSALDELASVGLGSKAAAKYANHSNTARAVVTNQLAGTVGTGATALAGAKTFGLSLVAPYLTAKLLASPRVVRWAARAGKTSLSPVAYADRLTRIARAEPAIANEVLALQQRLTDAFSSSGTRLAAQEPANGIAQGQGNASDGYAQGQGQQP